MQTASLFSTTAAICTQYSCVSTKHYDFHSTEAASNGTIRAACDGARSRFAFQIAISFRANRIAGTCVTGALHITRSVGALQHVFERRSCSHDLTVSLAAGKVASPKLKIKKKAFCTSDCLCYALYLKLSLSRSRLYFFT